MMEDDFLWNFGHFLVFAMFNFRDVSEMHFFYPQKTCDITWYHHLQRWKHMLYMELDILTQNHQRVAIPWVPWAATCTTASRFWWHMEYDPDSRALSPQQSSMAMGNPWLSCGCDISMWVWMNIPGYQLVWQPTAWLVTMGHVNFHISFFWREYTWSEWIYHVWKFFFCF